MLKIKNEKEYEKVLLFLIEKSDRKSFLSYVQYFIKKLKNNNNTKYTEDINAFSYGYSIHFTNNFVINLYNLVLCFSLIEKRADIVQ